MPSSLSASVCLCCWLAVAGLGGFRVAAAAGLGDGLPAQSAQSAVGASSSGENEDEGEGWTRFGANETNGHSVQPNRRSRFTGFNPRWSSNGEPSITGQPVSDGGRLFVANYASQVTARRIKTGEILWRTTLPGGLPPFLPPRLQSTLLVADGAVYATEYYSATLFKLSARTGAVIWSRPLATNPFHRATGSPALAQWRGKSLIIEGLDADENLSYLRDALGAVIRDAAGQPVPAVTDVPVLAGQRSFSAVGQVVAVDAETGAVVWRTAVNAKPSEFGIGVWSTAAIDVPRGRLYIGTGQTYNPPASAQACAILGIDLASGQIRQVMSFVPEGATAAESCVWSAAYPGGAGTTPANPDLAGPAGDVDVGSSPVLYTTRDRKGQSVDLVVAMNKAGRIRAFNRATSALVWERQVSLTGGSSFGNPGVAYADGVVYASVLNDYSSLARNLLDISNGLRVNEIFGAIIFGGYFTNTTTLVALDGATGETRWAKENLLGHVLGAPVVSRGVVYQATYGGQLRAFAASSGAELGTTTSPLIQLAPGFVVNSPFANSPSLINGRVAVGSGQGFGPADGSLTVFDK